MNLRSAPGLHILLIDADAFACSEYAMDSIILFIEKACNWEVLFSKEFNLNENWFSFKLIIFVIVDKIDVGCTFAQV